MRHDAAILFAVLIAAGCAEKSTNVTSSNGCLHPDPISIEVVSDSIAADMYGPNEGLPHGVPEWWDWRNCPVIHAGNAAGGNHAIQAWGQVHEASGGSAATNVRIQIRNLTGWMLRRSTNSWVLLGLTPTVWGDDYAENVQGSGLGSVDTVSASSGGLAVLPKENACFHFFWKDRAAIDPSEVAGLVAWFEARLVLDNPSGTDDLDNAHYVASSGFDYWPSTTSGPPNPGVGHGKTKDVQREWRRFYFSTLTKEQLRQSAPPLH